MRPGPLSQCLLQLAPRRFDQDEAIGKDDRGNGPVAAVQPQHGLNGVRFSVDVNPAIPDAVAVQHGFRHLAVDTPGSGVNGQVGDGV